MSEVERQRESEIAPSVLALLAVFHEHTLEKLALAPVDSVLLRHAADGITEIDEDGCRAEYDDNDEEDAIEVLPISVIDTENR
ncbi:hypothetical protein [Nocardia pseudovaccinii]|uniref:hypothetical protein n=1 Tax=Nocardia pseudovaccinii TaxID=189540 RepID=UPI0007A3BE6C|nr:hypothetical protein [Nocardia pseudovaccinii]